MWKRTKWKIIMWKRIIYKLQKKNSGETMEPGNIG